MSRALSCSLSRDRIIHDWSPFALCRMCLHPVFFRRVSALLATSDSIILDCTLGKATS